MYACATILLLSISSTYATVVPLPDGLIVTKTNGVKAVATEYEVLVVIQPPEWPKELDNAISQLRRKVEALAKPAMLTREDTNIWLKRLDVLASRLNIKSSETSARLSRHKRGFFNVIGQLSKTLFGTATTEDIKRIGKVLQKSSQQQGKIIHRINDILTVVNHSNDDIQQNRDRLNLVTRHLGEVSQGLSNLGQSINNLSDNQRFIIQNLLTERAVASIEDSARTIFQQEEKYKTQKMALEAERLTQDVLNENDLDVILRREETDSVRRIYPLQWYYEYCRAYPIWTESHLAYRIVLPLVYKDDFIVYNMKTFPEFGNDSSILVQLHLPGSFAEDAMTGETLQPYDCVGHQPLVCKNNIRTKNELSCAKAVIKGDIQNYEQCKVTLMYTLNKVRPKAIGRGEYIVSTPGETLVIRCPSKSSTKLVMSRGTFLIHVEDGCLYESDTWKLYGLRQAKDKVRLSYTLVDVPRVNTVTRVTTHVKVFKDRVSQLKELSHVKQIQLKPLNEDSRISSDINSLIYTDFNIIDICLIACIIPLYVLLGIYLYRICKHKCRKVDNDKTLNDPPESKMNPIISLHPNIKTFQETG